MRECGFGAHMATPSNPKVMYCAPGEAHSVVQVAETGEKGTIFTCVRENLGMIAELAAPQHQESMAFN